MPEYLLTAVSEGRQWEGKYGINEDYTLMLADVPQPAILTQKPGTPVPQVGSKMELALEAHPRFADKLRAKRPGQFAGGAARPEDPKRSARIQRMHSQDMSMRLLTHAFAYGLLDPPKNPSELFSLVAKTADWFDKDADAAGQRA